MACNPDANILTQYGVCVVVCVCVCPPARVYVYVSSVGTHLKKRFAIRTRANDSCRLQHRRVEPRWDINTQGTHKIARTGS
jgi:hypothetical protein